MKGFRVILISLVLLVGVGILAINLSLYYQPSYKVSEDAQVQVELLYQLNHLKEKLHGGAASEMQQIYPEGYVFLTALYGLSWVEVAEGLSVESALGQEAHQEVDWVIDELFSEEARRPFSKHISPAYGIFYRGWSNYVLGRKLKLLPPEKRDSVAVRQLQATADEIIGAWSGQESPFLPSYEQACWPADMMVAMASVAITEDLFPGRYTTSIQLWLDTIDSYTDSLGMISHSCDCTTGAVREAARGSSQSLILNFLWEIDPEFARKKFELYQEHFLTYRIGLPGILEYPGGSAGQGDIDSGPVIWGVGGAASLVGQRTMALYGESEVAVGLRNSIETFGLGYTTHEQKKYLFGELPIADAFIAWGNSVEAHADNKLISDAPWRLKTQGWSLLLGILGLLALVFLRKKSPH